MRKRLVEPEKLLWRTGDDGRTLYAVIASLPGDHDLLLGLMDSKKLAEHIVHTHNLAMVKKTADRQPKENP